MTNKSPKEMKKALKIRAKVASERPDFPRSETHRFPRLGDKWRSSKGIRSKMRLKKRGRSAIVETGYRGPTSVRGLHPTGKEDVLIHNVSELDGINPETQVVRISATSGKKKRIEIMKKAEELKIDVLNIRASEVPKKADAEEAVEEKSEETSEEGAEESSESADEETVETEEPAAEEDEIGETNDEEAERK